MDLQCFNYSLFSNSGYFYLRNRPVSFRCFKVKAAVSNRWEKAGKPPLISVLMQIPFQRVACVEIQWPSVKDRIWYGGQHDAQAAPASTTSLAGGIKSSPCRFTNNKKGKIFSSLQCVWLLW